MLHTISLAAVQLNAQPAPVTERLERAETLVTQAVVAGAQIILLPEVFNTGYEYSNQNYNRADSMEGPTVSWLQRIATHAGVYLAGTLFLRDRNDIYNAMLICSCPPDIPNARLRFPDGSQFQHRDTGPLFRCLMRNTGLTFTQLLLRQATWLGVPVIQASVTGLFSSSVPCPGLTLAPFAYKAQSTWRHLTHYKHTRLETGYFPATYIANAYGRVLAEVPVESEGYIQATVTLAVEPPKPQDKQPTFGLSTPTFWVDNLINRLMERNYYANRFANYSR